MDKDEALKLALETLEEACELIGPAWAWRNEKGKPSITAIKQALAASVQPVAWAWRISPNADHWQFSDEPHPEATRKRPLVFADTTPPAAQPEPKPLTKQQRNDIYNKCRGLDVMTAILLTEAAHGIKENT